MINWLSLSERVKNHDYLLRGIVICTNLVHLRGEKNMAKNKSNIVSMATVSQIAKLLVVVGGLNWGTTALGYNVVNILVGAAPALEQTVYLLVGIATLYVVYETIKK